MTIARDLDALETLAALWAEVTASEHDDTDELVEEFAVLHECERQLRAAGDWVGGPSNLMVVLGVSHDEVRNCRALRWLLDPIGRHALGDQLLTALEDRLEIDLGDHDRCELATEVPFVGPNGEARRADLVIRGDVDVVIEAKVNAVVDQTQLAAYEHAFDDARKVQIIRKKIKQRRPGWHVVEWDWIGDQVIALDRQTPDSGDGRASALLWASNARRL